MRSGRSLTILCLLSMAATACLPRQIRPVSEIDPSAMLEAVAHRRNALQEGVTGVLETDFRQGRRHFAGRSYIVAFPDGAFRLEIPGPMGSTLLVMVNNGEEVAAYYPEKGKAYLSSTGGRSINPHLPFPLPVETNMLSALLMGTAPEGDRITETDAHLMESGERRLRTRSEPSGLQYTYHFTGGQDPALRRVSARGDGLDLQVSTGTVPPYLPERFTLAFQDTTITGSWENASIFQGDESVLELRIPDSATVTDLRDGP